MMMDWRDAHRLLLEDSDRRAAYNKIDLPFEIGKMISNARIARNMTQERLAELMRTQQPSIARVEKGNYLPSFAFLQKIAKALNATLLPPRLLLNEAKYVNNVAQNSQGSFSYAIYVEDIKRHFLAMSECRINGGITNGAHTDGS